KALDTASKNAEDGASLIKTAEGYMGEVHDMLNRIVELAEKSANGTYEVGGKTDGTNANTAATETFGKAGTDRQALQDEVNQLCSEIDRIASTANFNELKLMDGSMDAGRATRDVIKSVTADSIAEGTWTKGSATVGKVNTVTTSGYITSGSDLTLQIGETSTSSDKLAVSIKSFHTDALFAGVSGGSTDAKAVMVASNASSQYGNGYTLNISNQSTASVVAEKVRDVINDVSSQRASLGALENRLDYTINNLTTASENITDANSRIRDTDMAKTMMQYTQGNTLTQAAQAMLAQANQAPSSVLQLLQ
ncbi:MAG: flagellin, partial [Ruminococcus sp.]|nr:flagellin [Ruminococcus sp.]